MHRAIPRDEGQEFGSSIVLAGHLLPVLGHLLGALSAKPIQTPLEIVRNVTGHRLQETIF